MTLMPYTSIETEIGYAVIGIDVDKTTGLVYCTTHAAYGEYTSDFRVYDSNLTLLDIERNDSIESPAGVAVGGYYGYCDLKKTDDVNDGNCVLTGSEITYTIDYNYLNDYNDPNLPDINDVNIIDYLPEEVDFVSASGGGIYDSDSQTVTWNIGTLHPGDTGSFTVTVEVTNAQPGGTITNPCEIRSGSQILETIYEYTSICGPTLTKVDDINSCVNPGDYITYTICYDANGYGGSDVNIVDTLPSEVVYVSSVPSGEYDDGTVTWDIGTLEPDESGCVTLTVQVNNPPPRSTLTNNCEIRYSGQILDTAYEDTHVCPYPTLTKEDNVSDGNCVGIGDYITYTICYDSNGGDDPNIVITDRVPDGVDFKSASGGGTYDSDSGSRMVTWIIDRPDPNDPNGPDISGCVTLTVEVNCVAPNSIITNHCEIDGDSFGPVSAYENTPVCPGPALTKTDNVPDGMNVFPGSVITYTICYDANGYGGTDVNFVDTLPPEVNYVLSDPCGIYDANFNTVNWHIGELGPNDVCCVTLMVWVKDLEQGGIMITNCCEVTDNCIDINACESTLYIDVGQDVVENPEPVNWAVEVNFWPLLKWKPVEPVDFNFVRYQVYFGTNYADVNNATTGTPVIYRGEFDVNWYDPCADFGTPLLFNTTYYWRIDEVNYACPDILWKGEVWTFTTFSGRALDPYPDVNSTTGFYIDKLYLGWTAGLMAANTNGHDVFFGTSFDDINNATTSTAAIYRGRLTPASYSLSSLASDYFLNTDADYYWRIDEINAVNPLSPWKGYVWKFTFPNFYIVDDFNYDTNGEMIARWKNNYLSGSCPGENYGGGATLALDQVGGALTFDYNNTGESGFDLYSEARYEYNSPGCDWTAGAVPAGMPKILSVSYLGSSGNSADPTYDRMYAAIRDDEGNMGVIYNPDVNAQQQTTWQNWMINLSDMNSLNVNLTSVRFFMLGFGQRCNNSMPGGTGTVIFDNILLSQTICVPEYAITHGLTADFTSDCAVNLADLKVMSEEWLKDESVTDIYPDGIVNLRDFTVLAEQWLEEVLWP